MKKKIIALITAATLLCTMVGCGGGNTTSANNSSLQEASTPKQETLAKTVVEYNNMPLCGDAKMDVALKSISTKGITFHITNKTPDIITIMQTGIALDGLCLYAGNNALLYEDIAPNSAVDILLPYELESATHQSISGAFETYINNSGFVDNHLSFSNINLGYDVDTIWDYPDETPQNGAILYEDNNLICKFYRIVDSMFVLGITNKSNTYYSAMFDSFVLNGQVLNDAYSMSADLLPGCEALLVVESSNSLLSNRISAGDTVSGIVQLYDQTNTGCGQFSFNMTMQ